MYLSRAVATELHPQILISFFFLVCLIVGSVGLNVAMKILLLLLSIILLDNKYSLLIAPNSFYKPNAPCLSSTEDDLEQQTAYPD